MIREILTEARRIAVLGYSDRSDRAGHYVPAYLAKHGFTVVGVNPRLAAQSVPPAVGPVLASLAEVAPPPDLVLVFRRSEEIPHHEAELRSLRPRFVWFQSGIRNDPVARRLEQDGIRVVQDRCMLVEHRNLASTGSFQG